MFFVCLDPDRDLFPDHDRSRDNPDLVPDHDHAPDRDPDHVHVHVPPTFFTANIIPLGF